MIYKLNERGLHHAEINTENQDCIKTAYNNRFTAIVLADGVSSCKRAREGAEIACGTALKLLYGFSERFMEMNPQETAKTILEHIFFKLKEQADTDNENVTEYSSTLSCVLYDSLEKRMLCLNLGDGMIMASDGGRCRLLAMPEDNGSGICTTTTRGALRAAQCRIIDAGEISSVAVFSDGAWRKLYSGNRLKAEAAKLISDSNYRKLKEFIRLQECLDDFSFVSIGLKDQSEGRRTA